MSIKPSDILFYGGGAALKRFGALSRHTTVIARRGEDVSETFTRTGTALYRDGGGIYRSAAANTPRINHYGSDAILSTPRLILEDARTNLLDRSSQFDDDATYWTGNGDFTISSKTSIIAGETAYQHNSVVGGESRDQVEGVFPADDTDQTVSLIVERVSGAGLATDIEIADNTEGGTVAKVRLDWDAGTASIVTSDAAVTATSYVDQLYESGPNDGETYLLAMTFSNDGTANSNGRAGNTREVHVIPGGDTALYSILHHCQLELGSFPSSPIVTGTSSASRNAEALSFPFMAPPQEMTIYAKVVERGSILTEVSTNLLRIGSDPGARFIIRKFDTDHVYRVTSVNTAGKQVDTVLSSTPVVGDTVELLATLPATRIVQIQQAINSAITTTATATDTHDLDSIWGSDALYLSSSTAFSEFEAVIIARGTHSMADLRALLP